MIYSNGPKTARFISSKNPVDPVTGPLRKPPLTEVYGLVGRYLPKEAHANRFWHSYHPSPDPCGPDTPCLSCEKQRVTDPKACGYPYPASPIPITCERPSPCFKQFSCQAGYRFPLQAPQREPRREPFRADALYSAFIHSVSSSKKHRDTYRIFAYSALTRATCFRREGEVTRLHVKVSTPFN